MTPGRRKSVYSMSDSNKSTCSTRRKDKMRKMDSGSSTTKKNARRLRKNILRNVRMSCFILFAQRMSGQFQKYILQRRLAHLQIKNLAAVFFLPFQKLAQGDLRCFSLDVICV